MARIGYVFAKAPLPGCARRWTSRKSQWRRVPRPQRHRREEPWRNRRRGICRGDRTWLRHGAQPAACRRSRPISTGSIHASRIAAAKPVDRRATRPKRQEKRLCDQISRARYRLALPRRIMKNTDFEGIVETSDEWIVQRTGIRQRHIAGRRRDDRLARRGGGARGARQCRPDGSRHRPHRAGDVDAQPYLSRRPRSRSSSGSACATALPSTCRRSARASSMPSTTADLHIRAGGPSACW